MDILAARKKASEQAKGRKKPEPAHPVDTRPRHIDEPSPPPVEPEPSAQLAAVPDMPATKNAEPPATAEASPGVEAAAEALTPEIELLSFRLGGEEYAMMVEDVREVLKLRELTSVPNTPDYILGVTSLRGTMLPVFDLGKRLGISGSKDEKSRIIITRTEQEEVGLMVDRVTGVIRIAAEDIRPAPENIEQGAEFLRGIARKDERLYILLDLEKTVET
ncbi:MAG TPA: chemotaxis protein CheW [Nitrospirota bacterium]